MFRVTGLKILGRVGTHKFFSTEMPFKMHKIIICFQKKKLNFTSKFR